MRAVARGIYPPLLDAEGLGPALGTAHRSVDLPLEIDLGTLPRYSKAVEETAYFCVLAALNQAKMAGATAANVDVQGDDDSLTVTVTYDSVAGLGDLSALTDRVDAFSGTVTTTTAAKEATLTLTLPVTAEVLEPA
jgi:signal transduction histidine kinase